MDGKRNGEPRPPVLSCRVTQHWASSGPIVQVGTPVAMSPLNGGDVTRVGAQARGGRSLSPVDTPISPTPRCHLAAARPPSDADRTVDKGAPEGVEGKSRPDTTSQIS